VACMVFAVITAKANPKMPTVKPSVDKQIRREAR
jgi:hypothetical protein